MKDNPLSEEQIKQLNEISKLTPEKQKGKLEAFLKTLNKEQMEFLQKGQNSECVFCSVVEGKIPAKKLYEDDKVIALLDIYPASKGHSLVIPKKHYVVTGQMSEDEISHMFKVANKVSKVLFDELKASGTNIIVMNGPGAGQRVPHVAVYVIPRYDKDGLNFLWEPKKTSDKELDDVLKKLKDKVKFEQPSLKKKVVEETDVEEEERVP